MTRAILPPRRSEDTLDVVDRSMVDQLAITYPI